MSCSEPFEGLARYGLAADAYRPKPLDPLRSDRLLDCIAGMTRRLKETEEYIDRAAAAHEPAFVLIKGKGGTGRTSLCNHLLARHCQALGIECEKYLVPDAKLKGQGQDPLVIFKRWLIRLRNSVVEARLGKLGEFEGINVDAEIKELRDAGNDLATFGTEASLPMSVLTRVLESKDAGLGVLFDGVKDYGLLSLAFEAFADARTLVVATVLDYPRSHRGVTESFERRRPEGQALQAQRYPVLNLDPIAGTEARDLVQFHWDVEKPGVDSPFDAAGLERSFADKRRPAGRILTLTSKVMENHAHSAGPGPAWPADRDRLFFTEDMLARRVPEADDAVPEQMEEWDD